MFLIITSLLKISLFLSMALNILIYVSKLYQLYGFKVGLRNFQNLFLLKILIKGSTFGGMLSGIFWNIWCWNLTLRFRLRMFLNIFLYQNKITPNTLSAYHLLEWRGVMVRSSAATFSIFCFSTVSWLLSLGY